MTDPRASVHALRGAASAGGGPVWATALAATLARTVPTRLVVPPGDDQHGVGAWLPAHWPAPAVEVGRRTRGRIDDVRVAWGDRRDRLTVVQSPHPPRLTTSSSAAVLVDFPLSPPTSAADRFRLARYRWVVANSDFTARWVQRRWGRPAVVLPPLVQPLAPLPKEPIILAVGRFVGGDRTKGQRALVEAFRRLGPQVHATWSLHLAGWVDDPTELDAVRAAAADLPVRLHADAPRDVVEALCGRASICWHACGLGVDPQRRPEHLEHFGISVVEAMSAGAVPLVFAHGGPAETVEDVAPTWHDLDDLVRETRTMIDSPTSLAGLADRARRRASAFGPAQFERRVSDLFGPTLRR